MIYEIIFSKLAVNQIAELKKSDIIAYKKLVKLLIELTEHPYTGIGQSEILKYNLSGKWSHRISDKHRLVYSIDDEKVVVYVITAKGHYTDK